MICHIVHADGSIVSMESPLDGRGHTCALAVEEDGSSASLVLRCDGGEVCRYGSLPVELAYPGGGYQAAAAPLTVAEYMDFAAARRGAVTLDVDGATVWEDGYAGTD